MTPAPALSRRVVLTGLAALSMLGATAATVRVLHAGSAAADGIVAGATVAADAGAAQPAATRSPSDRWLKSVTAPHRQLFDAPSPGGGIPLVHVMNYYDTFNKAYGVKDANVDAVLTFYGSTTFHALSDAAWAKYRLGEFLETTDASGKPAVANPWRAAPVVMGMTIPPASIEALQKRGATFILCNNALQIFAGLLAAKRGLEAGVVYEDLKANILPGVELVPAMVIAIEQANRAGISYHRQ